MASKLKHILTDAERLSPEERLSLEELCRDKPYRLARATTAYLLFRSRVPKVALDRTNPYALDKTNTYVVAPDYLLPAEIAAGARARNIQQVIIDEEPHAVTVVPSKPYGDYVANTLNAIKTREGFPDDKKALSRAAGILLTTIQLQDRVRLDDILAMAQGKALPDLAFRMVLNAVISDSTGATHDELECAWKAQHTRREINGMKQVGVGLTPEAARYLCLQKVFIIERRNNKLMQSDIADLLDIDPATVISAERDRGETPEWPRFFQSQKTIEAYAGSSAAARKYLERIALEAHYPDGVDSLQTLVRCVCYKYTGSIEMLGNAVSITDLNNKINPKNPQQLTLRDKYRLNAYLAENFESLRHLGITQSLLNKLVPDPTDDLGKTSNSFASVLNGWAELASETTVGAFAQQVAASSGKEYTDKAVYSWGTGKGLESALPYIVRALEENPKTQKAFARHKDTFLTLAGRTLLSKSHLSPSVQLVRASTLGRALQMLEDMRPESISSTEVLQLFREKHARDFTPDDYKNWKHGTLPADPEFPAQLVDTVCECLHAKSGIVITMQAREHLQALSGGTTPARKSFQQR